MTSVSAIHLWSPQQIKHGGRDLLTNAWWLITVIINKVAAALNSLPLIRNMKLSSAVMGKLFWKCKSNNHGCMYQCRTVAISFEHASGSWYWLCCHLLDSRYFYSSQTHFVSYNKRISHRISVITDKSLQYGAVGSVHPQQSTHLTEKAFVLCHLCRFDSKLKLFLADVSKAIAI